MRQVTPAVGIAAGRTLRRWYRAKGLTTQVRVQRVEHNTGRVYYRSCHKRKRLFKHNRGFLTVNDGPAFASQLARYLTGTRAEASVVECQASETPEEDQRATRA
jgi:hypothetical protein